MNLLAFLSPEPTQRQPQSQNVEYLIGVILAMNVFEEMLQKGLFVVKPHKVEDIKIEYLICISNAVNFPPFGISRKFGRDLKTS